MAQVQAKKKKDDWVDVPQSNEQTVVLKGESSKDDDWQDVPPEQPKIQLKVETKSQPLAEVKQDPSFLESAWGAINKPLTEHLPDYLNPSKLARRASEYITTPELDDSALTAGFKGFMGGATEGLADVASGFTSPLNLATMAATGGSSIAAKQGLGGVSRGLSLVGKGLSGLVAGHGTKQIIDPNTSLAEKGMGIAELAGGAAGMMHTPSIRQSQGKLGKIADNVIKPEEIPHDFNEGIDFTDIPNELSSEYNLHKAEVTPHDITSRHNTQGVDLNYDPYQSILEKQGKGELRSRPKKFPLLNLKWFQQKLFRNQLFLWKLEWLMKFHLKLVFLVNLQKAKPF